MFNRRLEASFDNDFLIGAILMDLSKDFDCLLIAQLHAYGFDKDALVLTYSYLKKQIQYFQIINTFSIFQVVISDAPQGPLLEPRQVRCPYFLYKNFGRFCRAQPPPPQMPLS